MSWYTTGKESEKRFDEEERRREEAKKAREEGYIKRWWMPATPADEDGAHLVFIDDLKHPEGFSTPFTYEEHNLHLNGHWRNWFTCLAGQKDDDGKPIVCPICASGDKPALVAAYTVMNKDSYPKKDGSTGNPDGNELCLFVCKSQVQKTLRRAAKKRKGLRGWQVELTRTSGEAPNTGDNFEFDEKVTLPKDVQPFNYLEILAPKTVEELEKILSGGSQEVEADDERVRF